ncbi:hypothetical protein [Streptomyces sp. NBC_00996]|uniref:hypothetical protein n=1 Tax=Streptomyces sp. NBC_00996 TaxID=2903710 RepID=UPI00386B3999|nr:hypothetical protein OG390_26970 [Streptomyces sp. NBC_00996]
MCGVCPASGDSTARARTAPAQRESGSHATTRSRSPRKGLTTGATLFGTALMTLAVVGGLVVLAAERGGPEPV